MPASTVHIEPADACDAQGDAAGPDSLSALIVGVLDALDLPIIVVRRDCTVVQFNRAAADVLGLTPSDTGRPFFESGALEGATELENLCKQVFDEAAPCRREIRAGDRRFVLRLAPCLGANGQTEYAVLTCTNVTAFRECIEQAIYEREYTKAILNAVSEALTVLDADLRVQTANRAFYDMIGVSREEAQGVRLGELGNVRWEDSGLWVSLRGVLSDNREFVAREVDCEFPETGLRTLLLGARRLSRSNGASILLVLRDITERKRAEEVKARLAAIVESSDDAIVGKDLNSIITSWNAGAQRLFGYTAAEAIGQPVTMLMPADRFDEEPSILERIHRRERIDHYETVRRHKDGTLLDISLSVSPVLDQDGKVVGASKIARDITARKQIEHALRASEERYRTLLGLLPAAVYTCQAPSGVITFYNEHAAELWGREPKLGDSGERFCGGFELRRPDGTCLARDQTPMAIAMRENRPIRAQEAIIERPDGKRITTLVNIDPIRDANGQVVGAINVFHDMTALKQAEQQLKEADRRKDEFLATLAHELRNPLAPIRNSLQILRMSAGDGSSAEHIYEMMDRQVAHMVRLVDDLLELSRISRGTIELKKERIELESVIVHALETSRPFIEAGGHHLEVSLPKEAIFLDGDLVRLSQVFANLLNNSAKYTRNGGNITVSAKCDATSVAVSIRDTGIGIPQDMLSRVFDMFAQVDNVLRRSRDGLGIGLNLVRTLVGMHGGSVEAHSGGLGLGSEFVVCLPLAEQGSLGLEKSIPREGRKTANPPSRRILLVDDNRDAANSFGTLLKFLGAEVQVTYDGQSALKALHIFRPSVLILDIGMPGLDGYEVARRVRRDPEYCNLVLIAITGWGQEEDRRRTREAGFDYHLVKPVEIGAVQEILAARERQAEATG
jgi:PAS domain S-box-containing protein